MSEPGRKPDPRAEDDTGDHAIERPFDRGPPSANSAHSAVAEDASPSEVRPIAVTPRSEQLAQPIGKIRAQEPSLPDLIDFERPQKAERPAAPSDESRPPMTGSHSIPETVEHLLNEGRWQTICELLGPTERANELPAELALVYAIARAETHPDDAGIAEFVIRTTARAHGLSETSPIARVIAKRIVRRSPMAWNKRPAPRGTISMIIVFFALVLGGGGGFWLSTTNVKLPLPSFLQSR